MFLLSHDAAHTVLETIVMRDTDSTEDHSLMREIERILKLYGVVVLCYASWCQMQRAPRGKLLNLLRLSSGYGS